MRKFLTRISSKVGAILGTIRGGTGKNFSATAQGNIPYFSGAGIMNALAPGTSGQFLKTQGAAADPIWDSLTGVTIENKVTADTTVANTITETTIYTFSVPGGTLSTSNRLRLVMQARHSSENVAGETFTLRLKYGATTLASLVVSVSFTSTDIPMIIQFLLSADGATNAQLGLIDFARLKISFTHSGERGTAAIDSTVAQNLVITVEWSAAGPTRSFTMEHAVLEKL